MELLLLKPLLIDNNGYQYDIHIKRDDLRNEWFIRATSIRRYTLLVFFVQCTVIALFY